MSTCTDFFSFFFPGNVSEFPLGNIGHIFQVELTLAFGNKGSHSPRLVILDQSIFL